LLLNRYFFKIEKTMPKDTQIGKIGVEHKAIRIEELSDRVKVAIDLYNVAQRRFEKGLDSIREWENFIRVLNLEIKNIDRFIAIAHHNMGVVQAQKNNLEKAKREFEAALEIDPEYAIAYFNLAVIFKKLGRMDKAKEFYQKATELGYEP
jgi:tetratricopeptide (TPR) repeat protein